MSVRIAVIGAGVMGADHAAIVAGDLPGAELQVVADADPDRARDVAGRTGARHALTDAEAAIARDDVDAVLIASPDATHEALTLACLHAGKPVLCEKPLAPTSDACLRIVEAEVRIGRKLVQAGFMRRFDPGYAGLKQAERDGRIGRVLAMHNIHRNVASPDWFEGHMAISNSASHEFDAIRFVLGTDYAAVTAFATERPGTAVAPVILVLETLQGQVVTVEVNVDAAYGYDVRADLVGERGAVRLDPRPPLATDRDLSASRPYAADWRPFFAEAYRLQNKAWLAAIVSGEPSPVASDAWDGYVAAAVAEAGVRSLTSRAREPIALAERPPLYARGTAGRGGQA